MYYFNISYLLSLYQLLFLLYQETLVLLVLLAALKKIYYENKPTAGRVSLTCIVL